MNIQELIHLALWGDADAQFQLGCLFMDSGTGKQNPDEAAKYWKRAATNGHSEAQFRYGDLLYRTTPSNPDGIQWLTIAAKSGSEQAWEELKRAASEDLSRDARFALGQLCLADYVNHPKDISSASLWLKEAALDGHVKALDLLFEELESDNSRFFSAALDDLLSEEKHYIPQDKHLEAMIRFAQWLHKTNDIPRTVHWLSSAADLGDISALCKLYELCTTHEIDESIVQSAEKRLHSLSLDKIMSGEPEIAKAVAHALLTAGEKEAQKAFESVAGTSGTEADVLKALAAVGNKEASQIWADLQSAETKASDHVHSSLDYIHKAEHLLPYFSLETLELLEKIANRNGLSPGIRQAADFLAGNCCHRLSLRPLSTDEKIELATRAIKHFEKAGDRPDAVSRTRNMKDYLAALNNPNTPHDFNPVESQD